MESEFSSEMTLTQRGSGFEIVHGWMDWRAIQLTIIALPLDLFLVVWLVKALAGSAPIDMSTKMVLIALAAVAFAIVATYVTLASWFNKTTVRVEDGKLTVRHGPVPWFGNRDLKATDLQQIYVTDSYRRGFLTPVVYTYHVHALTTDGKSVTLLNSLGSGDDAYLAELEIERYFQIENAPVRGEAA